MRLTEIHSNDEDVSEDAQDVINDFERGLKSLINVQQSSKPLPLDMFLSNLDNRANSTRKILRRYGVELEKARHLIQSVIDKYQPQLDKIVASFS